VLADTHAVSADGCITFVSFGKAHGMLLECSVPVTTYGFVGVCNFFQVWLAGSLVCMLGAVLGPEGSIGVEGISVTL